MVESGSEEWTEWTYEGRRKVSHRVATDGISACYKGSAYESCTCEEKRMIISSGGIAKAALLSRSGMKALFLLQDASQSGKWKGVNQ